MTVLRLSDQLALADLATYVTRARTLDDDGAMRLQASGTTLAAYVAVLAGQGLLGQGAVLGLRVMLLAEPADVDVTVSLANIADRLARRGDPADPSLSVPPQRVTAAWAAIAPPRAGWEPVGAIAAEDLRRIATEGIQEVATGAPEGSGGHAVSALRQRVWSRDSTTVPPVPAGAAFAAHVLGFLGDDPARVFASGRWTRLSTQTGHVLLR